MAGSETMELEREKHGVNFVDEDSASDSDAEVCVAEWVDKQI
jgi:hypothetical protein